MLSWSDDSDKKPASRSGSLRPSVDYGRCSSTRASIDAVRSPVGSAPKPASLATSMGSGSLPKASSLARPGLEEVNNAASGKIGASGWWHNMDNGYLNEQPEAEGPAKKGEAKPSSAFTSQFGVAGGNLGKSLFADEAPTPAPAQPSAPAAAASAPAAPISIPQPDAAAPPAASQAAVSSPAQSAKPPAGNASVEDQIKKAGWWTQMDNSILNAPPEGPVVAGAGQVKKGERVFGGGFTPQLAGNLGKSLFADEEPAVASVAQGLQDCSLAQATKAADEEWEPFKAAPPLGRVQ